MLANTTYMVARVVEIESKLDIGLMHFTALLFIDIMVSDFQNK
jgi:hypothetical protein